MAKLANQMIVGITIGAVAEALLFCERGGANMAKVREAITGGFADSRILQVHGQRMVERDFAPRALMTVQLKDMRNALSTAMLDGLLEALPRLAQDPSVGAIVLTGLVNTFVHDVSSDPTISEQTSQQVSTEVNNGRPAKSPSDTALNPCFSSR